MIGTVYVNSRQPITLRKLAEQNDLLIGSAVSGWELGNLQYSNTLVNEFNSVTPENAMKFGPLSPAPGQYDFSEADRIVSFAQENGLKVRGHTLVWTNQLPDWLVNGNYTQDETREILRNHILTVVGRYRGRVYAWDVVNEGLDNNGNIAENNFWMQKIGPEYIALAFQWAHEADPNALLFYNESYAESKGSKADGVIKLANKLLSEGVPIHGIGLEMHTGIGWAPRPQEVGEMMRRIADLSLQVDITEMDVRIEEPITTEELDQQAQIYANLLQACLEASNCSAFSVWGLTDAHSWIPYAYPGLGSGLIFDENYQPKPAYQAMIEILKER
jgi:endo-1,4-beta-xylanase